MDGANFKAFICLIFIGISDPGLAIANGNVGCLFNPGLCHPTDEWCFDDGAFGRCTQTYTDATEKELYRHQLGSEELELLEVELGRLFEQGYQWSHEHTQCIVQAILYAFQTGTEFSRIFCEQVNQPTIEEVLEDEDEEVDPSDVAYIRYTPSDGSRNPEFADEVYVPPPPSPDALAQLQLLSNSQPFEIERRSVPDEAMQHFSALYNTPDVFRTGFESKDDGNIPVPGLIELDKPMHPQALYAPEPYVEPPRDYGFVKKYNTPDSFRQGIETKDELFFPEVPPPPEPAAKRDQFELQFDNNGEPLPPKQPSEPGYSEGGLVYVGQNQPKDLEESDLDELLDDLDEWGFKRKERLDVKKPGPQFNTNNFAFQGTASTNEVPLEKMDNKKEPSNEPGQKETIPNEIPNHVSKSGKLHEAGPKSTRFRQKHGLDVDNEQYDLVDTSYAYIEFKDSIHTWKEGSHIISSVARLLQIPRGLITHERIDRNEVTFKVEEPNSLGLNASEVAKRIDGIKEDLRRESHVVVTSAGIGDKTKLPSMVKLTGRQDHEVYIVLVIVCGVMAALALSAGVLYLTNRHSKRFSKLSATDTEPSKHYQDLCRARMSSKNNGPEGGNGNGSSAQSQRIASLSRESDNSPSSRSSTSSWSEEPALTNMDVSTGQMVLTNMEDHLKNKDRLDSEWAALCSYEADPNDCNIAERSENEKKNRYPYALPYDHARVVLNELSNLTGSDYINASTITDHDPRNPAYIVTQGPLPHTAPDLWQMVWEQGCVVMVMLTRLVEHDTPMCHRYWPEEGSELYHIFEVHLVSEHIWCDDYLVRSFYLKNLKTGETRTVTQFHFLSWPDGGVPTSTKALLEFRRKVNKSFRGRSCPIVVHCSDGVGRSGTYILLDMVLNRMAKGAKEIDIAATLEHIRDQRASSVATKNQFQFVLGAVAEEIQAILRVLPQTQIPPAIQPPPSN